MTPTLSAWRQPLLFARQAIVDPHRGSALGLLWLYLQPLVLILIYTLVFSRFMGARLGGIASPYAYSLYLVPGLLLWTAFANTVNGMVGVYQSKAHIIKKLPVNLVVMPAYIPLVELFNLAVGLLFFAGFCLLVGHLPTAAWWLLPWVCATTVMLGYAIGLLLAPLSLFIPDIRPITGIALQLLFWLTPIVYLVDILPTWVMPVIHYHPIYWGIRQAQHIVLYGQLASAAQWAWQAALAACLLVLARALVRSLEKQARDLL